MALQADAGNTRSWQMTTLDNGEVAGRALAQKKQGKWLRAADTLSNLVQGDAYEMLEMIVGQALKDVKSGLSEQDSLITSYLVDESRYNSTTKRLHEFYKKKAERWKKLIHAPAISPFANPDHEHRFREQDALIAHCQSKRELHRNILLAFRSIWENFLPEIENLHLKALEKWTSRLKKAKKQPSLLPPKEKMEELHELRAPHPVQKECSVAVTENGIADETIPAYHGKLLAAADKSIPVTDHTTHVTGIVIQCAPQAKVICCPAISADKPPSGFPSATSIVNCSFGLDMRDDKEHRTWWNSVFGTNQQERIAVLAIGNEGVNCTNHSRVAKRYKSMREDQALAQRTLLVCNVEADGQTPARNTNLPGNDFWEMTVCAVGTDVASYVQGGKIESLSGTSMAAPVVTGVLAQVREAYPSLSQEQLVLAVKKGARPIVLYKDKTTLLKTQDEMDAYPPAVIAQSRAIWGWGLVNLAGALREAAKMKV